MNDIKLTKYKMKKRAGLIMFGYGLSTAAILILVTERGNPDWLGLIVALATGVVFGLPISFAIVAIFKTKTSTEGIGGYNAWALSKSVHWVDITAIKPFNLGGLRYVRVYSEDSSRPLWIPLFHQDQTEFEAAVLSLAPENNVIRTFFKKRKR